MDIEEALRRVIEEAEELRRMVESIKSEANGYDLLRYLKNAEAELMDVLHNLNQARKLVG